MGADGGYIYLTCSNPERFYELTGWLDVLQNTSCWAWKHTQWNIPDGYSIVGCYGTDCSYSYRNLVDGINTILHHEYAIHDGSWSEDIREYTFAEIRLSLETDPNFACRYYGDGDGYWATVPFYYMWLTPKFRIKLYRSK